MAMIYKICWHYANDLAERLSTHQAQIRNLLYKEGLGLVQH